MKKNFFLPLALVVIIILCAFSIHKPQSQYDARKWWDYLGDGPHNMYDNKFYFLDDDNRPDCPPASGTIYCEILAPYDPKSDFDDPKPDLSSISQYRMKFR